MHHPCAFYFAPPLYILLCTTLVHFTLHHPCAFCFAPPLYIARCTTLVHFALHHPCAFHFAPPLCISLCTTLVHCRCTTLLHRDVFLLVISPKKLKLFKGEFFCRQFKGRIKNESRFDCKIR